MAQNDADAFDVTRYLTDDSTYAVAATDGGEVEDDRDLPAEFGLARQEAGRPVDVLDYAQAGDRILWGDREQECVVARVVEPDDRIGQSLTASVIKGVPPNSKEDRPGYTVPEYGRDLQDGDVFLNPETFGTLTGKKFLVVQGPQGGFYAITRDERDSSRAVIFRAVRSYHKAKHGQVGQGAWTYEGKFDETVTVVRAGDEPDELDPAGDLPAYEDIRENALVGFDKNVQEHYEVGTVAEAFDEGLTTAKNRAAREFENRYDDGDDEEDGPWAEVPDAEKVENAGTPDGNSHSTATVTEIVETEYGLKAVLDAPAPWETPDGETPFNEAIKKTPWGETHRTFDDDLKAWTVDANELVGVARELSFHGYHVRDEADRR
jgi:hypothetical protein